MLVKEQLSIHRGDGSKQKDIMAELSSREPYFDNRKGEVTELRYDLHCDFLIEDQFNEVLFKLEMRKKEGMTGGFSLTII